MKNFQVLKDNTAVLDKAMKALTENMVYIGIPSNKTKRDDDSPLGNAAIGYIQEKGAPEHNLPARPHLIPGVKGVGDKIAGIFRTAGRNALEGKYEEVMKGMNAVGLVGQLAVQNKIRTGLSPPLAESTLARRAAKGFKGKKPLIRTGLYLKALSYVVRKKNQTTKTFNG